MKHICPSCGHEYEEKVKGKTVEERKAEFGATLSRFKPDYPHKMLLDFYKYWTEMSARGRKMRFEKQDTWELKLRLDRWRDNNIEKGQAKGKVENTNDVFARLINEARNDTGKQIGY